MDESISTNNEKVASTRSLMQLLKSPLFWTGALLGASTTFSLTLLILDKFHESSLKESKTGYEISLAKLEAENVAKGEEFKRRDWEYKKLMTSFEDLSKSQAAINEQYKSSLERHYRYCKDQVRRIQLSSSAYESMKQVIQFDTPQSPIENALYNIYVEAHKCVDRFEN